MTRVTLDLTKDGRTAKDLLNAYVSNLDTLCREDLTQCFQDWSFAKHIALRQCAHLSDRVLAGQRPLLHLMLDSAIAEYVNHMPAHRRDRLLAWLRGFVDPWSTIAPFQVIAGEKAWQFGSAIDLLPLLKGRRKASVEGVRLSPMTARAMQKYLVSPWPHLAEELALGARDE